MVTATPPQLQHDEIAAQRLACEYLLQACERSLYELRCALGQAKEPAEVRRGLRAADVLQGVLIDWRAALADLQAGASRGPDAA